MEHYKIFKLLNNLSVSKFMTRKYIEVTGFIMWSIFC